MRSYADGAHSRYLTSPLLSTCNPKFLYDSATLSRPPSPSKFRSHLRKNNHQWIRVRNMESKQKWDWSKRAMLWRLTHWTCPAWAWGHWRTRSSKDHPWAPATYCRCPEAQLAPAAALVTGQALPLWLRFVLGRQGPHSRHHPRKWCHLQPGSPMTS